MVEVTNELIYEILKKVQDDIARMQGDIRTLREEFQAFRGYQLAMQKDIHNIYERLDLLDRKVDRIERRLELNEEKV